MPAKTRIKILHESPAVAEETHDNLRAYVFVFPGIGTPDPETWNCEHQQPWLEELVKEVHAKGRACTVVILHHGVKPQDLRSWDDVLKRGRDALEVIETFRANEKLDRNPILLVCHSLGGVIAKQCLVLASWQRQHHDSLFQALHGLVFLSTPHLPSDDSEEWARPLGILLITLKDPDSALSLERELRTIAHSAGLFEDLTLPIPILSTWEQKPTRLRGLLWYRSEKVQRCILVDKQVAWTAAGEEESFELEGDHTTTCFIDKKSPQRAKLIEFLQRCLAPDTQSQSPGSDASDSERTSPSGSGPQCSSPELGPARHKPTSRPTRAAAPTFTGPYRHTRSLPDVLALQDTQSDPRLPCHRLEDGLEIEDFASRERLLAQMETMLAPAALDPAGENAPRVLTLTGSGGVGKTSVAARYVDSQVKLGRYDASLWVRCDSEAKMLETFATMAKDLALTKHAETKDLHVGKKIVLDWLQNPVKSFDQIRQGTVTLARWILVLDNVVRPDDIRGYLPASGGGVIIITTRYPLAANKLGSRFRDMPTLEVEPLEPSDAVKLLRKIAPRADTPSNPKAADDLAKRLDYLPLAIRQMGSIIANRVMNFADFLQLYNEGESHRELLSGEYDQTDTKYEYNLSTVLRLGDVKDPGLAILRVMSLLNPDNISTELLKGNLAGLLKPYPATLDRFWEARGTLNKSTLIRMRSTTEGEILSLHRTVQDAVRAQMSPNELSDSFENAARLMLEAWPLKSQVWHYPVKHWPTFIALLPHITHMHSHYITMKRQSDLQPLGANFAKILLYGGWFCHERGDSNQAKAFFDEVEEMCDTVLSSDTTLQRDVWMCQGCVATETNQGKLSLKYYEKLHKKTMEEIPHAKTFEEHDRLAIAYNELGIAYFMAGDAEKAFELFELALHSAEVPRRPGSKTASSIFILASANLGLVRWIQEEWDSALNILMRALQVYQRHRMAQEASDFAPGRIMHALGNVHFSQARHDTEGTNDITEGLEWHDSAYEHYRSTIGEDHHRSADVSHRLAEDFMHKQRFTEAEECIKRALAIYESKDFFEPEQMRSTFLKGSILNAEGRTDESKELTQKASQMFKAYKAKRQEVIPGRKLRQADFDSVVTFWSR